MSKVNVRKQALGWSALALVAMGMGLWTGCGDDAESAASESPAEAAAVVETRTARMQPMPVATAASGAVEAVRQVSPGTKILGRIERVPVREGDRVQQGDVLAVLESRDLRAAVQQAEAAVAMAEAQLENAEAQHRRMVDLHERGSVTEKALEDARAGYRVAQAALEQARANRSSAEVMLDYARVLSPIDGHVVARRVEAGDMAQPGAPLFTVEDLDPVKVSVQVPEADVVGLERGAPATLVIDVLDETFEAEIDRIVPAADAASRTFEVELLVDNPGGRIKSGMFARARFGRGEREALLVPGSAVVRRGQLEGLFVVDEGRARLRWVRLGEPLPDGRVPIESGLEPGEAYVVDPPRNLVDGRPIETR
jgi:RND family efflux transporter MFP subunit